MWTIRSTAGHGHRAKVSKHLLRPIKTKTETLFQARRLSKKNRHSERHTPPPTHTHGRRDKQGTGQGGLNVLDLVRCSVKAKACSSTALGAFLQCKRQEQCAQVLHPDDGYSLWQRSAAQPEACSKQRPHARTHTFTRPSGASNTLAGFKSRCTF